MKKDLHKIVSHSSFCLFYPFSWSSCIFFHTVLSNEIIPDSLTPTFAVIHCWSVNYAFKSRGDSSYFEVCRQVFPAYFLFAKQLILVAGCRFEKLKEEAFMCTFILKALNMIPTLGHVQSWPGHVTFAADCNMLSWQMAVSYLRNILRLK